MITLKLCPMNGCGGNLRLHCAQSPLHPWFSSQCDVIVCDICGCFGHIDGRRWPVQVQSRQRFSELEAAANTLRADLES